MRAGSPASAWSIARDKLGKARQASWSDGAKAQAAWATVSAAEPKLLASAEHMHALVEKLRYLVELSEPAEVRGTPSTRKPWKLRLLHSVLKDTVRFTAEVEQNHRCESLRRHAARLGDQGELAAQLAEAKRDLAAVRAERDAAYAALERANGLCRGLDSGLQR